MRPSVLIANGIVLAAALLWLLTLAVSLSQPYRAAPQPVDEPRVADLEQQAEFRRGWYGLVLRLDGAHDIEAFKHAVDELVAMNAESVLIETPVLQEDPESVLLTINAPQCPQLSDLVAVIHHATNQGLSVVLVPTLIFGEVKANQSRSRFAPADWDRWWNSYEHAIVQLAELAEAAGVDVFCVGSELSESEIMSAQWASLVAQVRSRYAGLVMYNVQWERATRVAFWKHVDLIGVSAWFPLTPAEDDNVAALEQQWRAALNEVDLLATRSGRPVLLTAVGYPSRSSGLTMPWEATAGDEASVNPDLQAAALRAFLSRFQTASPQEAWRAGFFVYRWGLAADRQRDATSHTINGKPAEQVVRDAFAALRARREN